REIVHVAMDEVELLGPFEYLRQLHHVKRERIGDAVVQPERARHRRHQRRRGARVAAREERDVVPAAHLFLDQVGDDALRTSVEGGRHALVEWSDVSDAHAWANLQTNCQRVGAAQAALPRMMSALVPRRSAILTGPSLPAGTAGVEPVVASRAGGRARRGDRRGARTALDVAAGQRLVELDADLREVGAGIDRQARVRPGPDAAL